MNVTLDAVTHIYTVEGLGSPSSMSKVLDIYWPPSPFFTKEGADKGTSRHTWYQPIFQGLETENEPDPRIAAEVEGCRKFMREHRPEFILGEVPMYDKERCVCGTADLYCKMHGRLAVVDAKPKNKQKRWMAQTAGYKRMLIANGYPVLDRYALRLLPGTYRLDKHDDEMDLDNYDDMVRGFHARAYYG